MRSENKCVHFEAIKRDALDEPLPEALGVGERNAGLEEDLKGSNSRPAGEVAELVEKRRRRRGRSSGEEGGRRRTSK